VLACAVRLLDVGFFRIGSEEYTVQNESYGLATMRKEHVRIEEGG
jgi:DNA topoisomerase IB